MKEFRLFFSLIMFTLFISGLEAQENAVEVIEKYRPQIHFTPEKNWVNDPNGMVYFNGIYHLFFQHSPSSNVWNEISWGHATSTDLVHWKRKPIAIYPDSLGLIFSGSAVVDKNNSSGFGKKGQIPLVAMYTSHDMKKEKAGKIDVENQSIAYSVDEGETWIKYSGNPILKNPGIRDFRDPKVFWHEPSKQWIATIAVQDHISFYASKNLRDWNKLSDFGKTVGAHGGVWECPDLFPLEFAGHNYWVLLVNINPGGPNHGSATQYFIGEFDGVNFACDFKQTKWLDYGPDEYAGVTFSNTGKNKILIGWMSNWDYANQVPTEKFRNGFTLPRKLGLSKINNELFIKSLPIENLKKIEQSSKKINSLTVNGTSSTFPLIGNIQTPSKFELRFPPENFAIELVNKLNEKIIIGFNKESNQYYLDRKNSGITDFNKEFGKIVYAPRFLKQGDITLSFYLDKSSIEVFADNGLSVLTSVVFPNETFNQVNLKATGKLIITNFSYTPLYSIWK